MYTVAWPGLPVRHQSGRSPQRVSGSGGAQGAAAAAREHCFLGCTGRIDSTGRTRARCRRGVCTSSSNAHRVAIAPRTRRRPFANGLYFFYEAGETSDHARAGRIVRVGNHPHTQDRLPARLREHYRSGTGAKNGSVLRRYLGGALVRRDDGSSPCLLPGPGVGHWERHGLRECARCEGYEARVTDCLRSSFRFRCVRIDDREERNRLEALLVATLAACPTCRSSPAWLGQHAYSEIVRSSGLWNSDFVGGPYLGETDLQRLEALAAASRARDGNEDLSETLLIIPCCQSKRGRGPLGLPARVVTDFVGERQRVPRGRSGCRPEEAKSLALSILRRVNASVRTRWYRKDVERAVAFLVAQPSGDGRRGTATRPAGNAPRRSMRKLMLGRGSPASRLTCNEGRSSTRRWDGSPTPNGAASISLARSTSARRRSPVTAP